MSADEKERQEEHGRLVITVVNEDNGDEEDVAAPLNERVERVVTGEDGDEEVHSRAR